jgi:hypothetical protein
METTWKRLLVPPRLKSARRPTTIRLLFNRDRHQRTLITSPDTIDFFARGISLLPALPAYNLT